MKKILVLSDSHGNYENMVISVTREKPDMILHLGDGWREAERLSQQFSQIPLAHVPGNCDYSREPEVRLLALEGFSVLICHGHTYNVKASLLSLQYAAGEKGADVVLFGHTHAVLEEEYNGIVYMNPGSIGLPGFQSSPSYGLLFLDRDEETIETEIKYL